MLDTGRVHERRKGNVHAECEGKTAYCSKGAAIERIKQSQKRKRSRRHKGWAKHMILVPYRCPHCHHWHVGGTDPAVYGKGFR